MTASSAHRHHRRRSRRHRPGDRAQGGRRCRASVDVCEPVLYGPHTDADRARFAPGASRPTAGRAAYDAIVARRRRRAAAARSTRSRRRRSTRKRSPPPGLPWSGHTDLLAHLTGHAARRDDVLLRRAARRAGDGSHPARRRAARADARRRSKRTIDLTARELPRFGYPRAADRRRRAESARRRARPVRPRRGRRCIAPAIAACRARGIDVVGPVSGRHASSSARTAASSTSSSPAITIRG